MSGRQPLFKRQTFATFAIDPSGRGGGRGLRPCLLGFAWGYCCGSTSRAMCKIISLVCPLAGSKFFISLGFWLFDPLRLGVLERMF